MAPCPRASTGPPSDNGYASCLGGLAWLEAGVCRCDWSGISEPCDRASLLLPAIDQTNMDNGSFDLAWPLTLEEEPPFRVFTRAPPPTSTRRLPLAARRWSAWALAYLKELYMLQTHRAEATRRRSPPAAGPSPSSPQREGAKASWENTRRRAKAKRALRA